MEAPRDRLRAASRWSTEAFAGGDGAKGRRATSSAASNGRPASPDRAPQKLQDS
jgi:hypothetical protein